MSFHRKDGLYVKNGDPRVVPLSNTHEDWFTHSERILLGCIRTFF